MKYRMLGDIERDYICRFISALVPVAQDPKHPMCDVAHREISVAMWWWTADGVDPETGILKHAARKYDFGAHAHTRRAYRERASGRLRHEHAVPRAAVTRHIVEGNLPEGQIRSLLERLCRAVIVTVDEERGVRPRARMPKDWRWEDGDPYERYTRAGLRDDLWMPPGG